MVLIILSRDITSESMWGRLNRCG